MGVCQRQMPNFLPPPVDPLLRKFAPQIRPKMGFGAWLGAVFVLRGPKKKSPPAGPLTAREAVLCGATSAPCQVPALIAMSPRDERGALVPARGRRGPLGVLTPGGKAGLASRCDALGCSGGRNAPSPTPKQRRIINRGGDMTYAAVQTTQYAVLYSVLGYWVLVLVY